MTSYEFGDIVLVPFPFTDQTGSKKRPAVVVNSPALQRESVDLIIMAVTTQSRTVSSLEVFVTEWQAAGLLRSSVIKPVFATIERRLIAKTLGRLQPGDLDELRTTLRRVFG